MVFDYRGYCRGNCAGDSFVLSHQCNICMVRNSGLCPHEGYLLLFAEMLDCKPYFQGFCGFDVFIWVHLNSSIYAEICEALNSGILDVIELEQDETDTKATE